MLHYRKSKINIPLVNKQKENTNGVWNQVSGRRHRYTHFNIYTIVFAIYIYIYIYVINDSHSNTIIRTRR